jgi:hypothetical protein
VVLQLDLGQYSECAVVQFWCHMYEVQVGTLEVSASLTGAGSSSTWLRSKDHAETAALSERYYSP